MCGRYTLTPTENLAARFGIAEQLPLLPRPNVAPSQTMPVVVRNSPNRLVEMQWGLVPAWSKEPRLRFSTINARAETVATSPVYRGSFKRRRCLVPASGFFEWQQTGDGKQPYCIRLKGGALFAFAGLYDIWRDADDNELWSYTIITTRPNDAVAPIHSRMPVILRREDEHLWLNKDTSAAKLQSLLVPYAADAMETFAVSRSVNNPANEGREIVKRLAA